MSYESDERYTVSRMQRVRRIVRREGALPFAPFGLLPALGLGLLALYALFPFAKDVERSAAAAATAALDADGVDWTKASASGQWVTLEGLPPSNEAARSAERVVKAAKASTPFGPAAPVTRVTVKRIALVPPARDPNEAADGAELPSTEEVAALPEWQFSLANGILRLTGDVPDEATRDAILEAARVRIAPPRVLSVEDELQVVRADVPNGYLPVALRGINTISQCDAGRSSIEDGKFNFRCELGKADASEVRAQAYASLPFGTIGTIEIITHEDVANCESNLEGLLGDARIEFASASAVIDPSSNELLDRVAAAVKACPGTLRIEGHTDSTGLPDSNMTLSRNRAYAVRNALIARDVSPQRLVAEGYGASRPIAVNTSPAGRSRNRRIEIRVVRASE
ncbi:MAG: OmpA family protein [Hyphomonas sp.]|uniref:OmpA family protein n=1 Tax=Hyphomonas sp. TaxID=87 RepID=UPI003527F2BE